MEILIFKIWTFTALCIGWIVLLFVVWFLVDEIIHWILKQLNYYSIMIDWIFHRKEFKAWLLDRRK